MRLGEIIIKDQVSSTNTVLKEMASNSCESRTVLIAKSQTNGRGRTGNSFFSPKNGIYMSLLLKNDDLPKDNLFYITPAAACAVRRAIFKISQKNVLIKWVNDLYLNEKKICGILAETSLCGQKRDERYCVLGIGLNVFLPDGGFPKDLKTAGSIFEKDEKFSNDFASKICAEILNNIFEILNSSPKNLIDEYKKYSFLKNKELECEINGKKIKGKYFDINSDFSLVIKTDDNGFLTLSSGEVKIANWKNR